jgi:hypothetical protein
MRRVAFMTYEGQPTTTADDRLGARALERRGYVVDSLVWDRHDEDLTKLDAVLVRSCWDYRFRPAAARRSRASCRLTD